MHTAGSSGYRFRRAKAVLTSNDPRYREKVDAILAILRRLRPDERNAHFRRHPRRAGNKIWGRERVPAAFREGQNCKNARFR